MPSILEKSFLCTTTCAKVWSGKDVGRLKGEMGR